MTPDRVDAPPAPVVAPPTPEILDRVLAGLRGLPDPARADGRGSDGRGSGGRGSDGGPAASPASVPLPRRRS